MWCSLSLLHSFLFFISWVLFCSFPYCFLHSPTMLHM
jgi:hypothetical protein